MMTWTKRHPFYNLRILLAYWQQQVIDMRIFLTNAGVPQPVLLLHPPDHVPQTASDPLSTLPSVCLKCTEEKQTVFSSHITLQMHTADYAVILQTDLRM